MDSAIIFWRSEVALGAMFKIIKRKAPRLTAQSLLGYVRIHFLAIFFSFFFTTKNTFSFYPAETCFSISKKDHDVVICCTWFTTIWRITLPWNPPPPPPPSSNLLLSGTGPVLVKGVGSSLKLPVGPQNNPPNPPVPRLSACLNVCVCGRGM